LVGFSGVFIFDDDAVGDFVPCSGVTGGRTYRLPWKEYFLRLYVPFSLRFPIVERDKIDKLEENSLNSTTGEGGH
jgi:hypothetical protein